MDVRNHLDAVHLAWITLLLVPCALGCGDDDGASSDAGKSDSGSAGSGPEADAGAGDDGGPTGDGAVASCQPIAPPATFVGCEQAGDFAPCTDDGYDACVSDDGQYHRISESISTIGRVEAFENIASLLFGPTTEPSPDDFLMARMEYQIDEGLDSRVVRRYDPHYDVPDGTDCTLEGVPDMHPEYCVGPAKLQPILLEAFNAGAAGDAPREQAARIEGALLYFLYVSVYKEAHSCTEAINDCDSSYAYYTGGAEPHGGIALARYVSEVDPYAHYRVWDGILAVRCWRDLDGAEVATDLALRDAAADQLDRALLTGVASVLSARIDATVAASGDERRAHWAFVRTLGPALLREAEARSADDAEVLRASFETADPADADLTAAKDALEAVFACP
jgi:hypothetical protein